MRAWFQYQWARFQNWRLGPLYEYLLPASSVEMQANGTLKFVREAAPRIEDCETERAQGDVSMSFQDLNRGRTVLGELPSVEDGVFTGDLSARAAVHKF